MLNLYFIDFIDFYNVSCFCNFNSIIISHGCEYDLNTFYFNSKGLIIFET